MNDESISPDLERRLARALHATAPRPAPGLADRCLRQTAATDQRRGLRLGFVPALAAAAVVLIAVVVGLQLGNLLPRGDGIGTDSTPAPTMTAPPATASPEPTPSPTAEPSPSDETFPGGQSCTHEEFGFTVDYPAEWWGNEPVVPEDPALTPIPGCTYFAEEPVELQPNAGVPADVAISVGLEEQPLGNPTQPYVVLSSGDVEVDGRPATFEEIEWTEDTGFQSAGDRSFGYRIELPDGEALLIGTSAQPPSEVYEERKTVLDLMMETLDFTDG